MSLLYDPSELFGTSGNVLGQTTLNNYPTSPSSTTFIIDTSNGLAAHLQIWNIGGGSVNAINGLYFQAFSTPDNVWYDTSPAVPPYLIPTVASTIQRQSFYLSTGKYKVQLVNTDPSNSISVMATTGNIV